MPFGDGTGPDGLGPMTGRAAGYCAGYPAPGNMSPIPGGGLRGRGRGGGGRGWRHRFHATGQPGWWRARMGWPAWGVAGPHATPHAAPGVPTMTRQQELDALKGQAEYFEDALEGVRGRIEEVGAKGDGQ